MRTEYFLSIKSKNFSLKELQLLVLWNGCDCLLRSVNSNHFLWSLFLQLAHAGTGRVWKGIPLWKTWKWPRKVWMMQLDLEDIFQMIVSRQQWTRHSRNQWPLTTWKQVNSIVFYLYIYIELLAVHTNQKRFQCESPREKRTILRERKEGFSSSVNKEEGVEEGSWFQSAERMIAKVCVWAIKILHALA